ncbi:MULTISPECIES: undecaprenyldiphospho-muramoylpentapeptide beta-N-acetylglucosaminyltransferase [unclassified Massilia]|uniref:undecaprenyldiphospho-muramoylpentapeptide beta-N-acetylglucosaminyltransferase n=1 Tax=unclassified Massilia TaxID=2609279 RepID=UPI00177CDFD0|nr:MULTISPECIES: undecaprenyldiphospho-muramoylpentapeptide beta-N-acetylglucosaminyltransferase [unclassified Massilia]MBD8529174.1 undecaprenyldiphospho-muramoylpentapeptide beta-N-acetylglucosaminyltransferase [Massilia sp. CFBP 13647]MBD8672568.1 undecaprenyldiphospho-muramoylpentapeptide beta-N-acetylglucosaminyltransferase [Massilia sp. CFBP 13721]
MKTPKQLMIMAAGTGGHIFPGVAIAQTMRERGWTVTWLGTAHGMEREFVPKHGIEMDTIDFAGLRGKGIKHTISGAFKMAASFAACLRYLGKRKPDVVLGMGGYVTVPGGMMARTRGIPLALVNADAALLLSNKTLTPLASRVLFGFPADFGNAAGKAVVTGNPVRQAILDLPLPAERFAGRSGPLRVLVVGGSLGAKVLNDSVPAALRLIDANVRPLVTHQSGKKNIDALRMAYKQAGVEANVVDFIDDMAAAYAQADLVICRAGAITVSELTAAGVASVLVPFVASTTSHQRDNAVWMDKQQAAIHLAQGDLSAQRVAELLQGTSRANCLAMAQAARGVGKRNANQEIADVLEQLANKNKEKQ